MYGLNRCTAQRLCSLAFCTLAMIAGSAGAKEKPDTEKGVYENRLEKTGHELMQLELLLESAAAERVRLQKEMQGLSRDAKERQERITNLNSEMQAYEQRVRKLEQQTALFNESIEHDRQQLARLIRQRQITRDTSENASAIKTLLSGQNVWMAKRRAVYLNYLEHASQQRLFELKTRLERIDSARAEAIKSRNWLAHLGNKARKQHTQIHASTQDRQASISTLDSEQEKRLASKQRLLDEQQNIEAMLKELEERTQVSSGYFLSLKKSLQWPLEPGANTKLLARFGQRKAGGKLKWNGILIERRSGQSVTAIADGSVVYADILAALGVVVVIEHGDGYLSLYGGNAAAAVKPGDWVEMGSTIATVGKIAGPNRETTYLEIRENAVPVNPEEWLDARKHVQLAAN